MNKKVLIVCGVITLILLIVVLFFTLNKGTKFKEYKNDYFKVKYDSSWKAVKEDDYLEIKHIRTDSTIKIQYKVLDDSYIDTKLNSIKDNLIDSIINQNDGFNLISTSDSLDVSYEGYSYLYEKDDEQVLVNIYKKDNVLVILFYDALSKYFDIVLDSTDSIINSLEIYSGEK